MAAPGTAAWACLEGAEHCGVCSFTANLLPFLFFLGRDREPLPFCLQMQCSPFLYHKTTDAGTTAPHSAGLFFLRRVVPELLIPPVWPQKVSLITVENNNNNSNYLQIMEDAGRQLPQMKQLPGWVAQIFYSTSQEGKSL